MTAEMLAGLEEAIGAERIKAGRLLAGYRHAAGLSQAQLARRIGYSATVVAHAELGRRPVSVQFWDLADQVLGAGGCLGAEGFRIKELIQARQEERGRLDAAIHAGRLARGMPGPAESGQTRVEAEVSALARSTSATGRCPHCQRPLTLVTQLAALPDPAM